MFILRPYLYMYMVLVFLLSACSAPVSSQKDAGYHEAKAMVLDILKSEDGKKAILAASMANELTTQYDFNLSHSGTSLQNHSNTDERSKKSTGQSEKPSPPLISKEDSMRLQIAVQHVLSNNETAFLKNLIKDPKFSNDFAKAILNDTSQLQKQLLKDPEYQKLLLDVMKNQEYEKLMLDTMKTIPYRHLIMNIIEESFESPIFRSNIIELFKVAIKDQSESSKDKLEIGKSKDITSKENDLSKNKDKASQSSNSDNNQ